MKNKVMKKISALAAAVCLTISMGTVAAGAAPLTFGSDGKATGTGTEVSFAKVLRITNPEDGTKVYVPDTEFSYTTSLVGKVEIPEGGSSETGVVKTTGEVPASEYIAGGSVPASRVKFPVSGQSQVVEISGKSADVTAMAQVSFADIKWNAPGVFRFSVKEVRENTSAAYNSAYVDLSDEEATRYIDVYVNAFPADNGSVEYRIVGYVMLRTVTTADGKKTLAKSSGYDDGGKDKTEGGDATLGAAVTKYETQNLTIRKVLNGSLAKANEEFNFNVTINNTQQIVADMMSNTNTAGNGTESFSGNVQKYAAAVRGGDSITIRGIAKNADVNVVENQNDAKNYTTEITSNGEVKKDIKSKTAQLTMNGERELTYTNTSSMENVTPTGFARMVAPYMIIVALALFLAVVFLRGKQSV